MSATRRTDCEGFHRRDVLTIGSAGILGLSLPEHGYHAPNENYDWGQASGGMAAFAEFVRGADAAVQANKAAKAAKA